MTNVLPASTYLRNFESHSEKPNLWRPLGSSKASVKDEDTRNNEAFRRGQTEGRLAALLECEERYAEERRLLEEAHAKARAAWVETESSRMAGQLADGLTLIESRISALVARVLEPFVEEELLQKAKLDLTRTVHSILSDGSNCTVTVRGPQDFCDYMRVVLPDSVAAKFEVGSPEFGVVIGETEIETRILHWVSTLKKACHE